MASTTAQVSAADLASCDREPIHMPGSIQPHGVLMALSEPVLRVVPAPHGDESLVLGGPHDRPERVAQAAVLMTTPGRRRCSGSTLASPSV